MKFSFPLIFSSNQSQPAPAPNHNTQPHANDACKLTRERLSPVHPAEWFELHYSCSAQWLCVYHTACVGSFLSASAWQPRWAPVGNAVSHQQNIADAGRSATVVSGRRKKKAN